MSGPQISGLFELQEPISILVRPRQADGDQEPLKPTQEQTLFRSIDFKILLAHSPFLSHK
jgi:hypothetical protein